MKSLRFAAQSEHLLGLWSPTAGPRAGVAGMQGGSPLAPAGAAPGQVRTGQKPPPEAPGALLRAFRRLDLPPPPCVVSRSPLGCVYACPPQTRGLARTPQSGSEASREEGSPPCGLCRQQVQRAGRHRGPAGAEGPGTCSSAQTASSCRPCLPLRAPQEPERPAAPAKPGLTDSRRCASGGRAGELADARQPF